MPDKTADPQRSYLLLQGPHGPFFRQLAGSLTASGGRCTRVGFNQADRVFWGKRNDYIGFRGDLQEWPATFETILDRTGATDLVLYGDARPVHASAIAICRSRGLRIHVFEEGYLRPYWVTYERDGSNGNSRLMSLTMRDISQLIGQSAGQLAEAPDHWGALREHVFYGAAYHFIVMTMNAGYRRLRPHRGISVLSEFRLYLRKLLLAPWTWATARRAIRRLNASAAPYHLVLLQLEHDASFRSYSRFDSQIDFVTHVLERFHENAPKHHHLAFKTHPLEDGRVPLEAHIRKTAARLGIPDRVHFLAGGKLGPLLDHALTGITVNSTAAQQALWRGIPVFAFGDAVYHKPEFVCDRSLETFFSDHPPPDIEAYRLYRTFLLRSSQIPGSFYSSRGRRQLLRLVVEAMLDENDPYALAPDRAASTQHTANN